jgi:hypothetical protein
MSGTIDALRIRQRLGRDAWGVPEGFGPDGWLFESRVANGRILVTVAPVPGDDSDWIHASMSWADRLPDYDDLVRLHKAVWPDGYAYQVFAPPQDHINIHPNALHLWGRPDGRNELPPFGAWGTI